MSPDEKPTGASLNPARPETKPFSIRLTSAEKQTLRARAGRVPLGTYIRSILLGATGQTPRRKTLNPVGDHKALARVLAALGRSRLSSNLNQLAKAVNIGVLPATPDTEQEILQACQAVMAMRHDLIEALGLNGGGE